MRTHTHPARLSCRPQKKASHLGFMRRKREIVQSPPLCLRTAGDWWLPHCWPLNLLWITCGSVLSFVLLYLRRVGDTERCVSHTHLSLGVRSSAAETLQTIALCGREYWPLMLRAGRDFLFCRICRRMVIASQSCLCNRMPGKTRKERSP